MIAEVLGVMLRHGLVSVKRPLHSWMIEIAKCAVQEAVVDLGAAFRAFFEESG